MAVLGGFSSPIGGRLEVLSMSEDGLTLEESDMFFTEFNQRIRDVAVNPNTGAIYLAFNGPSYTGNGPNLIKEFRPASNDGVANWEDNRGLDIYPNPAANQVTLRVSDLWTGQSFEVLDLKGNVMMQGQLNPGDILDVRESSGTHFEHSINDRNNFKKNKTFMFFENFTSFPSTFGFKM